MTAPEGLALTRPTECCLGPIFDVVTAADGGENATTMVTIVTTVRAKTIRRTTAMADLLAEPDTSVAPAPSPRKLDTSTSRVLRLQVLLRPCRTRGLLSRQPVGVRRRPRS